MNDPLRIVIVDDEALARAVVREYADADPTLEIVADCGNGFEAVKAVSELKPDLVLLDVQMPKLDGFEVLELLGRDQPVVFITAYDQYALQGVRGPRRRLPAEAVQRGAVPGGDRRGRASGCGAKTVLPIDEMIKEAKPRSGPAGRVLIRDGANVHVLPVDKIDYVEAQDDYVAFKSEGKQYLKDQTLGGAGGDARSRPLRPHPPVVHPEHRSHLEGRAVCEGQPHGDPPRRHPPAGEPRRLRAAVAVAVNEPTADHEVRVQIPIFVSS